MVKGLALSAEEHGQKQDKPTKTFDNGPGEETDSTMTHKEIDEFATRFNLSWQ